MRARNIKPGFFKDENLAECSIAARLLAPGLWMMADKEGRLEDRPKRIKMEIFPADSIEIEPLLYELQVNGHIIRYEIDTVEYIEIPGFKEHQSPHYSEKESIIPSSIQDDSEKVTSSSKEIPLAKLPDSLIPDSLIPDCSVNTENARAIEKHFDEFWKEYPNKVGKGDAEKKFSSALKIASSQAIMDGLRNYIKSEKVLSGYVCNPATWLHQKRWQDDYQSQAAIADRQRNSTMTPQKSKTDLALEEYEKKYVKSS